MDWSKIEQQIARLNELADDQNLCGVDAGRTGQCHAAWNMETAADTMQALLDVAKAADRACPNHDGGFYEFKNLREALAKLEEL